MIGKKIGNLEDIVKKDSELNRYILMGVFDNISLGGEYTNPKNDFYITPKEEVDTIMIQTIEDNRLSISLAKRNKNTGKVGAMRTILEFVIYYKEKNFPIYNSQY
ncbi:MAG: hypothetical protein ACOCQD_02095 [archaeon]